MEKKAPLLKRFFGGIFRRRTEASQPDLEMEEPQPIIEEETPPPPPPPRPTNKELWGTEFKLVDEGLAEEQVAEFVSDLMNKCTALENKQKYYLSLGSVTERAAIEADKVATATKNRMRSEAEAEAARILAAANQRSQEMMIEAKRAAQEATKNEVQNILQSVLRKGAITELQAKQQAQLFLVRSREAIEDDLRDEVKESYNRILNSLEELLGKGRQLEMEWGDMTDQLRKREIFDLEWHEAGSIALAGEIVNTPPLISEGYDIGTRAAEIIEAEEAR